MNSYFAKKLITLIALPSLLLSFTFLADKANFSGDWKLNESKSDFGQRGGRFATRELKVDQKDNAISITRITPSFQGGDDVTSTETLPFDGKEVEGTGFANSTRKSSLKWAGDGQTFTITTNTTMERNGQTISFSATETWALGDEGKSLTITTTRTTPQGEMTTK